MDKDKILNELEDNFENLNRLISYCMEIEMVTRYKGQDRPNMLQAVRWANKTKELINKDDGGLYE